MNIKWWLVIMVIASIVAYYLGNHMDDNDDPWDVWDDPWNLGDD